MTNADKFKEIFGLYATEFWAKPEKDMLKWLNMPYSNDSYNNDLLINAIFRKDNSNYCNTCPNNLKNGGNGVCNCILGSPVVIT